MKQKQKEIKFYVSYFEIMGLFAKSAVQLSPYPRPENLELVLSKVHNILSEFFDDDIVYGYKYMGYYEIEKFLFNDIIEQIPECVAWNNRVNGREGMGFISRDHRPTPDGGFIDLHAFAHNITNDIAFSQYNGDSIPDILNGKATKRMK